MILVTLPTFHSSAWNCNSTYLTWYCHVGHGRILLTAKNWKYIYQISMKSTIKSRTIMCWSLLNIRIYMSLLDIQFMSAMQIHYNRERHGPSTGGMEKIIGRFLTSKILSTKSQFCRWSHWLTHCFNSIIKNRRQSRSIATKNSRLNLWNFWRRSVSIVDTKNAMLETKTSSRLSRPKQVFLPNSEFEHNIILPQLYTT